MNVIATVPYNTFPQDISIKRITFYDKYQCNLKRPETKLLKLQFSSEPHYPVYLWFWILWWSWKNDSNQVNEAETKKVDWCSMPSDHGNLRWLELAYYSHTLVR